MLVTLNEIVNEGIALRMGMLGIVILFVQCVLPTE